jgi:hypothetical protein
MLVSWPVCRHLCACNSFHSTSRCTVRDTLGTSLYFAEYDIFRYLLGRTQSTGSAGGRGGFGSEIQGPLPHWAKGWIPVEAVPFLCGSLAGVTSWAAIYPLDVSLPVRRLQMSDFVLTHCRRVVLQAIKVSLSSGRGLDSL